MKINSFENNFKKNQISFKSGKVKGYFDFDDTYLPVSHAQLKSEAPGQNQELKQYCQELESFFYQIHKEGGFNFSITTGRTLGEYEAISNLIREKGYKLPFPDSVIVKNGSDEYIKTKNDGEFYVRGIFPFNQDSRNLEKEQEIRNMTNWDADSIRAKVKNILESHDFDVVEADSENSVEDYGTRSLFSQGKLRYEDKTIQRYPGMSPKSDWNVGLRNDGKSKIYFTLPYDTNYCPERTEVKNTLQKEICGYLDKNGVKYGYYSIDNSIAGRPAVEIEPLMHDKTLFQRGLTKLYDTKKALERAIKENDLVIVAGDGSNDKTMLNPLSYLNIDKEKFPLLYKSRDPKMFMEYLTYNEQQCQSIIKQLEDMPFLGIVVKRKDSSSPLEELIKYFGPESKYQKIIPVEQGKLKEGIKEAIKIHSKKNGTFFSALTDEIKKEVFNIPYEERIICGKIISPDAIRHKAKLMSKNTKIAIALSAIAVTFGAIALIGNKIKKAKIEAQNKLKNQPNYDDANLNMVHSNKIIQDDNDMKKLFSSFLNTKA